MATINPTSPVSSLSQPVRSLPLLACHDCDALQYAVSLPRGGKLHCIRCGALLHRHTPQGQEKALAYVLTAFILFLLANLFPLLTIESQGQVSTVTLLGAVAALFEQDMQPIALLVFLTVFFIPTVDMLSRIYLLYPLLRRRPPRHFARALRLIQWLTPWSMLEVLLLGVLVSIVKLVPLFNVVPGIALWSLAGLIVLLVAQGLAFNQRDLWSTLEVLKAQ